MGKSTRPSAARLTEIVRRQDPPLFGRDYDPAIRATREEAPPKSRPTQVWWDKLGRYIHTLSLPERAVLIICLYSDRPWEIQEQRMLPPMPRPHPLAGHPKAAGMILGPMRGTIDIAESLGVFPQHPFVRAAVKGTTELQDTPFPWIGDLLMFLEDDKGPYLVNFNIKSRPEDFDLPEFDGVLKGKSADRARTKAKARHAIEAQLYADIGVRTVQPTSQDWDENVVANLLQCFAWHKRPVPFRAEERMEILDNFRAGLLAGESPLEICYQLGARNGWALDALKSVMFKGILQRQLRIDLYQPILIDRPMKPERRDVLDAHSDWFRRT